MKTIVSVMFILLTTMLYCQQDTNTVLLGNLGRAYDLNKLERDTCSFVVNEHLFRAFKIRLGEFDLIDIDEGNYPGNLTIDQRGYFTGFILRKGNNYLFLRYAQISDSAFVYSNVSTATLYNSETEEIENIFQFRMGYLIGYSKLTTISSKEMTEELFLMESSTSSQIESVNALDLLMFNNLEYQSLFIQNFKTKSSGGYTRTKSKKYFFGKNITM